MKYQDLEDTELTQKVWTGVVPVRTVTDTPIPTEYSKMPPPEHVLLL